MKKSLSGVAAAIRSLDGFGEKGTITKLAPKIGVTRSALYNWRREGIPLKRLPRMMEATGLSAEVLRPDYREAFQKELGMSPDLFFKKNGARKAK